MLAKLVSTHSATNCIFSSGFSWSKNLFHVFTTYSTFFPTFILHRNEKKKRNERVNNKHLKGLREIRSQEAFQNLIVFIKFCIDKVEIKTTAVEKLCISAY